MEELLSHQFASMFVSSMPSATPQQRVQAAKQAVKQMLGMTGSAVENVFLYQSKLMLLPLDSTYMK
jgi:hypothetical protein